ncbi:DEAD/DEAH box helicase [Maricaulis maris]|uniref:DEAD/DEAH box helicase n=1 Tax=Maricaulis maris TaxID=74318 RepID=UPI003B8D7C8E
MTYGTLAKTDRGWRLSEAPPHVAIRLKHIFPRLEKASRGPFHFPADDRTAADLDWFRDRYPVSISPADNRALIDGRLSHEETLAGTEKIFSKTFKPPSYVGLQDGEEVRPYQAQAVELLRRSGGILLADDVGLGKTYTTCAALLVPGMLPGVVVCQPHLQRQWVRVIERFTSLTAHAVKKTTPYDLPDADVLVFRYTQLAGWVDTFDDLAPGLVAFDEIQELRRGTQAEKGKAALELVRSATYRLGLSATPIYNYGREIYTIFQYLNPEVLGDEFDFVREWCSGYGNVISDPLALGAFLRDSHVYLRRIKSDVGQQLPKVSKIVDRVDYDAAAVRSIDELARQLAIKATTGQFTQRGQAARELDILVRQQTGIAKAAAVADVLRILVEGGEPVLVAGWHRDVYDIWAKRLSDLKPAYYTGTESAAGKDREVRRFINGETDLMFMSLRSGAGLDGIQARCSTVVFGELDWSPGVHAQVIGRLDREGQTQPVTALFLVTDDGSDPPMMEMLGLKASQAAQIVDQGVGPQAAVTDRSRLKMLVERYLQKGGRGS